MTKAELEDIAYRIATGNTLAQAFNKYEYDEMNASDIYDFVWQPFELLSEGELCQQIQQIADEIIDNFKGFVE